MTAGEPLRVLIVDDSVTSQEFIRALVQADPRFNVVAMVSSGAQALAAVRVHRPQIITLDLQLPDMDGFEVVRQIMAWAPTPIMVLTASLSFPGRKEAPHALSLGALDVAQKPTAQELQDPAWVARFANRLAMLARSPVVPHVAFSMEQRHRSHQAPGLPSEAVELVVMVGSAGAARAVSAILQAAKPALPLRVPVLIAIHLGGFMGESLARFLADDHQVPATVAQDGAPLRPGVLHVAPGGQHVQLHHGRFQLLAKHPQARYRPDLNLLLRSVAAECGASTLAIMLSGLGDDGAQGMLAVRQAGGQVWAQDFASCVVPSMPRSACTVGAVDQPSSLGTIAAALAKLGGHVV